MRRIKKLLVTAIQNAASAVVVYVSNAWVTDTGDTMVTDTGDSLIFKEKG